MPIPQREFTTESLSKAISYCLSLEAAVRSFHKNLPLQTLSCDVLPDLPAAFCFNKGKDKIKLSSLATEVVIRKAPKDARYFKLYVPQSLCKISILMSMQIREQAHKHRDTTMGPYLRRSLRFIRHRHGSHNILDRSVHRIPRRS
jgi:hypothetical protein